jgi:hypothetical protein
LNPFDSKYAVSLDNTLEKYMKALPGLGILYGRIWDSMDKT